jgi:hypothetical protein
MRDPNRIRRIAEKLVKVWGYTPDCRLGQLVSNLKGLGPQDIFYFEDDQLEERLDQELKVLR